MSAAPQQGETLRLKYGVDLRRGRAEADAASRPYVGLEHIEPATGRLLGWQGASEATGPDDAVSQQTNIFEPGDVLFGKLRPYLAKSWVADFSGRCTTELLAMTPRAFEARFLRYVCLSPGFISEVDASTFGSKMPRAEWDFIGSRRIPAPPIDRQRAIADYLDRETANLDAMVVAKERLLELLAEKRRALTTHAVTRGLNPNARFRDSGIEWLGEVPSHWRIERLAFHFEEVDERCRPELPLLEVSLNHGVIRREFSSDKIEGTASDFNTYKAARSGDIVFNKMRMWQGAVGVAPLDGLVSPDYVVARPTKGIEAAFAALLFRTPAFSAECGRRSYGLVWDRLRLYWDGFRDIRVALPPLEEQAGIVSFLSERLCTFNAFEAEMRLSTALLRERRAALITVAVTGAIDVETAA